MSLHSKTKFDTMSTDQPTRCQSRALRPKLTIDTRSSHRSTTQGPGNQSAPVGTRQERGILPMYQAGDRHCAKVAEMMNSPTWRSQNDMKAVNLKFGALPAARAWGAKSFLGGSFSGDDPAKTDKTLAGDVEKVAINVEKDGQEEIHLGQGHESLDILGIDRFPGITDATKNTFIISATVPTRHFASQSALLGQALGGQNDALEMQVESAITPGETQKNTVVAEHSSTRHTQSPISHRSCFRDAENTDEPQKLIEQDQAIKSIKYQNQRLQTLPPRRRLDSPGEKQRFKGLLDRLHHQFPETAPPEKVASLNDPAIISYIPRKTQPIESSFAKTQRRTDSGYISASDSISRGPSRLTQHISENSDHLSVNMEHKTHVRTASLYQSPSKNSTLNPAAKEFSSFGASLAKSMPSSQSPNSNNFYVPRQQYAGSVADSEFTQFAPVLQATSGSCVPPLPRLIDPLVSIQHLSTGSPLFQNTVSAAKFYTSPGTPIVVAPLGMPPPSAGMQGLAGPEFGLDWATSAVQLPISTASSNPFPVAVPDPFHQNIPNGFLCNIPAHQGLGATNPPLPSGCLPNNTNAPLHAGPAPFIPKHVPKPKIPNTAGQQNWELMHELRRMNEPGYALKCKEKQKKRYMKQLEKNSGAAHPLPKREKASNSTSCDKSENNSPRTPDLPKSTLAQEPRPVPVATKAA